jgi:hypothetical protein
LVRNRALGSKDFDDVTMIAVVDAAVRWLEEPDGDEYAYAVRLVRFARRESQDQLAALAGLSQVMVGSIERADHPAAHCLCQAGADGRQVPGRVAGWCAVSRPGASAGGGRLSWRPPEPVSLA